jgi:hypothetical protein
MMIGSVFTDAMGHKERAYTHLYAREQQAPFPDGDAANLAY